MTGSADPTRLALKPLQSTSGYVDGAWWPHSLDLVAELPGLVTALFAPWGAVDRVSYDMAAWAPAERRVTVAGRRIRLDGFRGRRPAGTVNVVAGARRPLTLLVVPPDTEETAAQVIMRRAATEGNQDSIDDLSHGATGPDARPADPPEQKGRLP